MDSAITTKHALPLVGRLLRRIGSVLLWTGVLVAGAFGLYFSFANYPGPAIGLVLAMLLLAGYSERKRRKRRAAAESARSRARARRRDAS